MKNHLLVKSPDLVLNTLNRVKFVLIAIVLISSCKKDSTEETKTTPVTTPPPTNDSAYWSQTSIISLGASTCYSFFNFNGDLYAGTANGVFMSSDTGINWTARNTGINVAVTQAMANNGSLLFAGKDDEVVSSPDNGVTWNPATSGLPNGDVVHDLLYTGTRLYAGFYGSGIYFSANNGVSWIPATTGLTNMNVNGLVKVGTTVIASTSSGGVFKSPNNGSTWTQVNTAGIGLWNETMTAIGNRIFVGSYNGMFVSSDEGATWTAINNGINSPTPGLGHLTTDGTDLYFLSDDDYELYVSKDYGANWSLIKAAELWLGSGANVNTIAINKGYLFAGTNVVGVWKAGPL